MIHCIGVCLFLAVTLTGSSPPPAGSVVGLVGSVGSAALSSTYVSTTSTPRAPIKAAAPRCLHESMGLKIGGDCDGGGEAWSFLQKTCVCVPSGSCNPPRMV